MAKHVVEWVRRAAAQYWFGSDTSSLELPPLLKNNEFATAINAAGTGLVNMIKGNASNVPELGAGAVITGSVGTGAGALVTVDGAQTLTAKTLTTPTIQQINDTNGLGRVIYNPTAKTIVDGSATSLADIACASGTRSGGFLWYNVEASDGTEHQSLVGLVTYACVNKAGTLTLTITEASGNQAKAVTGASTLTLAWTFVTGTNKGTIKLQPTGSLTETTYQVWYTICPMLGAATIL